MSFLSGKKVLVTGAAGFLGAHLCERLRGEGCRLFGLDRSAHRPNGAFAGYIVGELADEAAGALAAVEPDVIFHLAGAASVPDSVRDPARDFDSTIPGTARLLAAAAKAAAPPRLIYFSSAAVYGEPGGLPIDEAAPIRPLSPYGAHKAACEALLEPYARIHGLPVSILRIFSAYGEGLRRQFFWEVAERALAARGRGEREITLLGTGSESRDFVHAADIARAACLIAERGGEGTQVYNVAAGEETTIASAAARFLALLAPDLRFSFEGVAVPGNPNRWRADIRRLRALGFELERPLAARLPDLARWIVAARGAGA
jgi:UDP-glucose 4-epimerase